MNFNIFLNHQTKTIGQAGVILAVSALISRFLGITRDWLLAKSFGAGADLDIYFAAFKIPDLVYNILILGGVVVAFLPLFSEYFSKDPKEAWEFSSNCLNVFLTLLILLSFFLFIFTPLLVKLIAPGFDFEKMQKTIILTRIMFLSPIFFGLSSIFSGILQHFNRFLVYSLCPILYNIGIIFGILFLSPGLGIIGVALGVILGAFMHFAIQVPSALNCGFFYKPILDFRDSKIKRVFLLMIPRTFGVSASQLNLVFINAIASTLSEGSISIFNFANNIQYFPIGIIGASFAMASFSALSRSWAKNEKEEFIHHFSLVFRQILYLIIPVSILIFILRNQIVEIILRHGQFSNQAALLTSASLGLFCIGIFASSLILLFFRAFFALKDTKTPTLIAVISVALNIFLSFVFTQSLKPSATLKWQKIMQALLVNVFSLKGINDISVLGLSLATSVSVIFQFILLFIFLKKKIRDLKMKEIYNSFCKIFIGSILMIITICFILVFINSSLYPDFLKGAFWEILLVGLIGFLVYYFSTAFVLHSPETIAVKSLFIKNK